ncbi:NAD(P)H-dependent flavin oxidoreductase [Saccharopolyspora phatthalungensis]|uniref:Propionate 3-nitronate monooxygenase n=1 Tax=Saccharopolyspora phatthalungensis TaxID=664693 RepID=A0A840Q2K7_9PSEU|nr:nitronate monooxygenase [Saccharopolyspora phatthalungensis]MBB5152998.1 nitronate monooxygenase [Saccharopolyspora phatthalungensis]
MIAERGIPLIAAPMAGGVSTPELAAAVSAAGGLGFLAGGYLSEEALAAQIADFRALTSEPFGVNLFVPGERRDVDLADYRARVEAAAARHGVVAGSPSWDDDTYLAKAELVIAERVPVVSFTFGLPERSLVDRLHEVGAEVVATVTTPQEARAAANAGADLLCVQGMEAGGHRAVLNDDPALVGGGPLIGLLAAIRLIRAEVDLPVIAAGGLVHGADVAAVLSAGAVAAQLGTAFLVCDEAGTQPTQRAEIAAGRRETALTRAFSGRPARGLVNRFLAENADAPAAYPQLNNLTKPMRGAAGKAGDPELLSLWAGQTYAQTRPLPAAELMRVLTEEARQALDLAAARLQPQA